MILDSNIIIYAAMPENKKLRKYLKSNENNLTVSIISKLEVLGYHKLSKEEKELFLHFFASINIIPINDAIIEKAIQIKQTKKASLGDSIIAASAILFNQPLLTNNAEDFTNNQEIDLIPLKSIL